MLMRSGDRRVSNIRIYMIQYAIFLFGAILLIGGIYVLDIEGLATAGFIFLTMGAIFIVLSYIYARYGARVIGTNCPFCHGTGFVDTGKGKEEKEVCPVCEGSGKMYDKSQQHLVEEEKRKQLAEKETSDSGEIKQED